MIRAGLHADVEYKVDRKGDQGGRILSATSPRAGHLTPSRSLAEGLEDPPLVARALEALTGIWIGMVAWVRLEAKLLWINREQRLGSQDPDIPSPAGDPLGRGCQLSAAAWPPSPPALCLPQIQPCLLLWAAAEGHALGPPSSHPGWPNPTPALQIVKSEAKGDPGGARDALSCALRQQGGGSVCVCAGGGAGGYLEVPLSLASPQNILSDQESVKCRQEGEQEKSMVWISGPRVPCPLGPS